MITILKIVVKGIKIQMSYLYVTSSYEGEILEWDEETTNKQ